ncbi:MAG: rhodanese-like domain-containing protein [Epsilonproteobacteria bacterium]|nr:rhodanese-like domain-containing protein [Campylobacterota bacterium]
MSNYTKEDLQNMLNNSEISSQALETLLKARENGDIDFKLVDIREVYEYTDASIKGTDLLLPTSVIHLHMDKLEALKNTPTILYCRTGNRTGHVLSILKKMGFDKMSHLSQGILSYRGEIVRDAAIPNKL